MPGPAPQNLVPSDYDLRMRQLRPGDVVEVRPAAEIGRPWTAKRARRRPVHARDAPAHRSPLHGVETRGKDLRHDRADRKPPDARTSCTSRTSVATGRGTVVVRRAAASTGRRRGFGASTATPAEPTSRGRVQPSSSSCPGGNPRRPRDRRRRARRGVALPGNRGDQGNRTAEDVGRSPVLARAQIPAISACSFPPGRSACIPDGSREPPSPASADSPARPRHAARAAEPLGLQPGDLVQVRSPDRDRADARRERLSTAASLSTARCCPTAVGRFASRTR